MDEGTGEAFVRVRRSPGEDEISGIDDLGKEKLLGAEEDLLGDVFGDFDEPKSVYICKIRVIRVPFT